MIHHTIALYHIPIEAEMTAESVTDRQTDNVIAILSQLIRVGI